MNKHCVILGASGEIGSAIAIDLAKYGYTLTLHYNNNKEAIEKLINQLPNETVLQIIQSDLSYQTGIEAFINQMSIMPTHLVFASGQAYYGLLQDTSIEMMDHLYHIHAKAVWMITKACLPSMVREGYGNIGVISSIWGETGASCEVIYSSVKGAQNSFVKALAQEVARSNIRINAVSPGFIDTKMNQQLTSEEKNAVINEIPANRAGKPEEVAALVTFLFDEKSAYVNGENIKISGAW
ncbi:elongation factor P 5-aminopentanone reductase [Paraliobacillus quinghaiensis]|nr:SDR family oxidoreductase [Paraliobacillus quinghaiensis]